MINFFLDNLSFCLFFIPVFILVFYVVLKSEKSNNCFFSKKFENNKPVSEKIEPYVEQHSQEKLKQTSNINNNDISYHGIDPNTIDHISKEIFQSIKKEKIEKKLILVVDDSLLVRTKLEHLLGKTYNVFTAENGEDALFFLDEVKVDLIITDLEMPIMNGFDFITALTKKETLKNIPVIAITGNTDLNIQISKITSIYGFFNKPFNDDELLNKIKKIIN